MKLTDIDRLEATEHDMLLGTLHFLGADFHVEFLRVKDKPGSDQVDDLIEPGDDASEGVRARFADLQTLHEGAYETVALPGRPGRWVMCVFPFSV